MSDFTFQELVSEQITDQVIQSCADLFSEHYGVWAPNYKPGHRVKMSEKKLKEEVITDQTVLVLCFHEEKLVGHVFASVWNYEARVVGWITQLVVHKDFRRRHIATRLISMLRVHPLFAHSSFVGVVSSHPVTCDIVAKYANAKIGSLDLRLIKEIAPKLLLNTPVHYLKNSQCRGSLFETNCTSGAISSIDTNFYVDHTEPLKALKTYKDGAGWCLGELLDGHEFLLVVDVPNNFESPMSYE